MRGKEVGLVEGLPPDGITPACAGKSHTLCQKHPHFRDHPRMCGEKASSKSQRACSMGSPPHVRGKDICVFVGVDCRGITPACAGKRRKSQPRTLPGWDHPRMCGEKENVKNACRGHLGSPPRMRGKVHARCPARPSPRDHPRVCGEKTKKIP